MDKTIIASLYEYGIWANDRLLALAAKLTPEQLARESSKGYLSIHQTFVHLVSADTRWFARWKNETLPTPLTAQDVPTLEAIRRAWEPLIAARRAYLAGLSEDQLREPLSLTFDGRAYTLPRWQGIVQAANHATQHRSEIAAMLTDAGHSPGDIDYLFFCLGRP